MRDMKGRIVRKLKSISPPTWKPPSNFQAFHTSNLGKDHRNQGFPTLIHGNFSVSEITVDVEDKKSSSCPNTESQENFVPSIRSKMEKVHHSNSSPDGVGVGVGVASVQLLVDIGPSDSIPPLRLKVETTTDHLNNERVENKQNQENLQSISEFEDKCPPGGRHALVLYTTSLRGIRKTFEDCNAIRFLLESFRVMYYERDVSMHMEYREELWRILGGRVVPPKLFIKGRYIGGADEVVALHEKGMLGNLLQGMPLSPSSCPCRGCAGMRFVLCLSCNGSRKVVPPEGLNNGTMPIRCPDCNENGLIKCSVCS